MSLDCVHHWDCGSPRDGTVPALCLKCGARADFPALGKVDLKAGFALYQVRPRKRKEEKMSEIPHAGVESTMVTMVEEKMPLEKPQLGVATGHGFPKDSKYMKAKHREYEARKAEIIAEYSKDMRLKRTARVLGIPISTMVGLLNKWGVKPGPGELPDEVKAPPPAPDLEEVLLGAVNRGIETSPDLQRFSSWWNGFKEGLAARPERR